MMLKHKKLNFFRSTAVLIGSKSTKLQDRTLSSSASANFEVTLLFLTYTVNPNKLFGFTVYKCILKFCVSVADKP